MRITYKNEATVLAKIYMKKIKRPAFVQNAQEKRGSLLRLGNSYGKVLDKPVRESYTYIHGTGSIK